MVFPPPQPHQKVLQRYGDEQLDKHIECLVQSSIPIQPQDPKVHIVTTQSCLKHVEAYGHTLQLDVVKDTSGHIRLPSGCGW